MADGVRDSTPLDSPFVVGGPGWTGPGVVVGVVAAITVYVTTVLLLFVQLLLVSPDGFGGLTPPAFAFGTLGDFYGSHLGATTGTDLGVVDGPLPAFLYYTVPVLVLAWAGRGAATDTRERRVAMVRGASITLGYAPVVALGLLFPSLVYGSLAGLSPVRVLLVAGIGYPLCLGALGGISRLVLGGLSVNRP